MSTDSALEAEARRSAAVAEAETKNKRHRHRLRHWAPVQAVDGTWTVKWQVRDDASRWERFRYGGWGDIVLPILLTASFIGAALLLRRVVGVDGNVLGVVSLAMWLVIALVAAADDVGDGWAGASTFLLLFAIGALSADGVLFEIDTSTGGPAGGEEGPCVVEPRGPSC